MTTDLPLLSIVIPVFDQWEFTEACLQALARTVPAWTADVRRHQIVVVDNGSTDKTQNQLAGIASGVWSNSVIKYIRFEDNRGFNAASNAGAQASTGEVLVLLNNDTVPQTGWIEGLWATLSLPGVGIVGPKLLFPDTHTVNHIGYSYNRFMGGYFPLYFDKPATFPPVGKPRAFQALLGACLMVRRDDFMRVGMFSLEGLEDIDLCLKIRELGKQVRYTPRSEVWHHGGATFRNTKPELIPKMCTDAFNARWPSSTLLEDDAQFYREDGYSARIHPDRAIELIPEHENAKRVFVEAQTAWNSGARPLAVVLARTALEIYPRNIAVIKQLAIWLVELDEMDQAALLKEQIEFLGGLR